MELAADRRSSNDDRMDAWGLRKIQSQRGYQAVEIVVEDGVILVIVDSDDPEATVEAGSTVTVHCIVDSDNEVELQSGMLADVGGCEVEVCSDVTRLTQEAVGPLVDEWAWERRNDCQAFDMRPSAF